MSEREVPVSEEAIVEVSVRLKAELRQVRRRFDEERRLLEERSFAREKPDKPQS